MLSSLLLSFTMAATPVEAPTQDEVSRVGTMRETIRVDEQKSPINL